jgi:Domain of unknown function (DUF4352)
MRLYSVILITIVALFAVSCRDSETPKAISLGTFNMGEKAQVGPITYTVFDTKWELSLGEQPTPRIPTNRFFILNISAVNTAGTAVSIPTFSLVGDNGQVYSELDNGEGMKNWLGFVRRVRPAESAQGAIAFDVPQKHFKLRVADEEDHFAMIDIPLSLGDALPENPGAAR